MLQESIEKLFSKQEFTDGDRELFEEFKQALRSGEVRSAQRDADGRWNANVWVKQAILLGFRMGKMIEQIWTGKTSLESRASSS